MFLLDSLLIGGIRFVLDKVAVAAEQQDESVESVQQALVEAQLQLEEDEITEAAFAVRERELLARLRELRGERIGGLADADSFDGIEVSIDDDTTDRR